MGFPVGYTDLFLPKLLVHILFFLSFIRKFISWLFQSMGLGDFLESDIAGPDRPTHLRESQFMPAILIREILPVMKFEDLISGEGDRPDSCAVCLYEFEGREEIRRLTNCRHIFHRSCLDPWMDHDQKTCPLCRSPFIPDEMQEAFNDRLRAASDFYGEYSPVTGL